MIKPTARIKIDASTADVIGFIADPANAPRWMKALEVAELITPGPIGVRSRFREVQSAGGHCESDAELEAIKRAIEG